MWKLKGSKLTLREMIRKTGKEENVSSCRKTHHHDGHGPAEQSTSGNVM